MQQNQLTLATRIPPKLIGAGFMLLWGLSFSSAMAAAKTLSPDLDSLVLLFMRCLFGFLVFSPFIIKNRGEGFKTTRPALQLFRVTCIGLAMLCTYYAYRNLPLAFATSIGMTGPLFTTVLSVLILKDSVTPLKVACILFGYLGVLVIVRPHEMPISFAVWVELLANIFAALSIVCVKVLSRTESTFTIMLYSNVFVAVLATLGVLFVWETPATSDLLKMMLIGGLGVFTQYCSVSALKHANPSFLAPFEYTRVCFAIPVGYVIFDELPTLWMIVGSLMIVGATYFLTRLELKNPK